MSATYTPNLNLAKPDREDYVSVVTAINDNMDILDGSYGALGTIRPIAFALAVGDWTLDSGVYKATFVTAYVTATSKNIFVPDSGWTDAAGVKMVRHSGGGGIDCETTALPSGTITGTLYVIDAPDGKIPVLIEDTVIDIPNGGTGQSSLAGIQNAFQIGDPTQLHTVAKTNLVSAINENTDHLANLVKQVDVDGTTDASGNITTGVIGGCAVLALPIRNATGYYTSFYTVSIGCPVGLYDRFVLHCVATDGTPIASTAVKIKLYYI